MNGKLFQLVTAAAVFAEMYSPGSSVTLHGDDTGKQRLLALSEISLFL